MLSTKITEKKGIMMQFDYHIPVSIALNHAREKGLSGRLEIQHLANGVNQDVVLSMYIISEENKMLSAVFPFPRLFSDLTFDKVITPKAKE